jgi:hypothetical protein
VPSLDTADTTPALTTIEESPIPVNATRSSMDEGTTTADQIFRPSEEIDIETDSRPHVQACESLIPNHSGHDRVKFS